MLLKEIDGDLFSVNNDYALAHCVSCDCKFGAGIALQFRNRFKGIDQYCYSYSPKVGSVIRYDSIYTVFNLFTKEKYWHKPSYASLNSALVNLKQYLLVCGIKKLAIPRIGSGLDKLYWGSVKESLGFIFGDTDFNILVFYKKV